jgi:integrase
LAACAPTAPLFVGADGERISRGTLQYRVLRTFRRAGIDASCARGAFVHGLRHTFATELANSEVSVYTLMKRLGHESMVTSSSTSPPPEPKPVPLQLKTSCTAC